MENIQDVSNGSFTLGSGANNPYWGGFRVFALAGTLDNNAGSEEIVQLHEISGKVTVRITKDDGSGRPASAIWPVLIFTRTDQTSGYGTSDNSLEGFIGSSSYLNAEFEYQKLTQNPITPTHIFYNPTSTNYEYIYYIPLNLKLSRYQKRMLRSTEQMVDTPSVFKSIHFFIYGPDGTVQSFCYWTGVIDLKITRKERGLFAGPNT